ncbi:MAG: hypothetical protein ABII76_13640 [Pseudomonadota bacterium]
MSRDFDAIDEEGRSDLDALLPPMGFLYYVLLVQDTEIKRLETVNQRLRDHASYQNNKLKNALKNAVDIASILEAHS